jgi:predicted nucleic acid-binding protein
LSHYFDASVLVPMLIQEAASGAVDRFVDGLPARPVVSDLAAGEVASALSRLVRMAMLTAQDAQERLADFDAWRAGDAQPVEVINSDIEQAAIFVRSFDLGLRMPDALHLAISQRQGFSLVTLDARMVNAGQALSVNVLKP